MAAQQAKIMNKEQIAAYQERTTTIQGIFVHLGVIIVFSGIISTFLFGLKVGNEHYRNLLELCMMEHTFEKCEKVIND